MRIRAALSRLGLLLALSALIAWASMHRALLDPTGVQQHIQSMGPWGPLAFIVLFAFATVVFLPGALFGLAGGALFGPLWGTVWSLTGATLGATLAFLTARHMAHDWIARRADGRLQALLDGVDAEGWRFVAFLRLVPVFPFNLLNYALGLTRIPLVQYVPASALAMLPGTLAYSWLGYAGSEMATGSQTAVHNILLALGLMAVVVYAPRLLRRLRQRDAGWIDAVGLNHRLDQQGGAWLIDVRGGDEFNGPLGHIATARNIPLDDLPSRLAELEPARQLRLTLVCRTDKRSAKAAALVRQAGFTDVAILRGGMEEWNRQGFEVTHDAKAHDSMEDRI